LKRKASNLRIPRSRLRAAWKTPRRPAPSGPGKPTRWQKKLSHPDILWNPLKEARKMYKHPEPSEQVVSAAGGVGIREEQSYCS
jgi:hypothetical protein